MNTCAQREGKDRRKYSTLAPSGGVHKSTWKMDKDEQGDLQHQHKNGSSRTPGGTMIKRSGQRREARSGRTDERRTFHSTCKTNEETNKPKTYQ